MIYLTTHGQKFIMHYTDEEYGEESIEQLAITKAFTSEEGYFVQDYAHQYVTSDADGFPKIGKVANE